MMNYAMGVRDTTSLFMIGVLSFGRCWWKRTR